jgi:hypothetical protein
MVPPRYRSMPQPLAVQESTRILIFGPRLCRLLAVTARLHLYKVPTQKKKQNSVSSTSITTKFDGTGCGPAVLVSIPYLAMRILRATRVLNSGFGLRAAADPASCGAPLASFATALAIFRPGGWISWAGQINAWRSLSSTSRLGALSAAQQAFVFFPIPWPSIH